MLRTILSVLAGVVVLTLASFAIEAAVDPMLLHLFPAALSGPDALRSNQWTRALTFAYGFVCVAGGGYVAARLARRSPLAHAAAAGIVQALLTVAAMLSPVANHASRAQWIMIAILSIPSAFVGGVVFRRSSLDSQLKEAPAIR